MGWSRIWGHAFQKAYFRQVLASGRISHAYLFSGPPGVGKKTFALEVARALLCLESQEEACGRCQSCLSFEHAVHPDFFLLEPEKHTIGIDAVREFLQRISLKRVLASWRVGIIDDAEKLTEEAANCLLKTVEEPPEQVVLFLVTSQVAALPQTLSSRCQHLVFSPLPEEVIAEYLVRERGVEPAFGSVVALLALGSIGEALRYAQGWDFIRGIRTLLSNLREGDIFQAALWLSEHREELPRVLHVLARYFRDALFLRLFGRSFPGVLGLFGEEQSEVEKLALLGPQKLKKILKILGTFSQDVSTNASWDVALFHFLFELRGELV